MINVINIVKKETQMMSAGLRRCYVINFHFYVYRVDSIENHLLLSDKIINFRFFFKSCQGFTAEVFLY